MIRLACTNCRQVLTIDDAFAGGVCRCQHCGTIQTVPAAAGGSEVTVGGPNLGGARTASAHSAAFGSGTGYAAEGTGLDDLAGAVASSGLSSRRLLRPEATPRAAAAPVRPAVAGRRHRVPLFAVAGGLLGVITYLVTRGPAAPATGGAGSPPPAVVKPAAAANFCGTPLSGDTVVYVLDRGSASQEIFPAVKEAAFKSAASLGSDHHFQVVLWASGTDEPTAYPAVGTAYATRENVEAARRSLDDANAYGHTDVGPALTLALGQHPDLIVVATAKGGDLEDAWAKDVLAARGTSPARVDTFSLGSADASAAPALKAVADRTGGTFAAVSNDQLKAAAD